MTVPAEEDELGRGAAQLGLRLDGVARTGLIRYLDLLYAWNKTVRLTAVPRGDAVRLHLIDSLTAVRFLPEHGKIADLGSGGGVPGIPIAIALPAAEVSLVETRRKKCSFLTEALRELRLDNCAVLERDAGRLGDYAEFFDAVVARAFLGPAALLDVAAPILAPEGRLIVMGARNDDALTTVGAKDDRFVRVEDEAFPLFGGGERRRIVVLRKSVAHTR